MKTQSNNIPEQYKTKISTAMAIIGSIKSEKKSKAARENGRKGGRPVNPNSARQKRLKKDLKKT